MAETFAITNVTPGKVTFVFRDKTYVMGGEAAWTKTAGLPDYALFTSSVELIDSPGERVTFSPIDEQFVLACLKQCMLERNMIIELLP